jgi:single-strand DNA-binding protein
MGGGWANPVRRRRVRREVGQGETATFIIITQEAGCGRSTSMFNEATLIGNVGRDPETRSVQSGDKVANFSLATSERWKAKDGERQERTEWHNVVVWGPLADVVERFVRKGTTLLVKGQITTRTYTDKDGNERRTTEIVVRGFGGTIQMIGGKKDGESGGGERRASATAPAKPAAKPAASSWDEDDVPF